MGICKERAWDVLNRLSFNRNSASEDELKAAQLLLAECEKAGIPAVIEDFEVSKPTVHNVKLEITKPYTKEFYCTGQGRSGNTPEEGICGPLVYIGAGSDEELIDIEGKIVMTTGMNAELRKKCVKKGAIGYIVTWGGIYDDEIMISQVPHRDARISPDDTSNFPGVMMNLHTAQELLKEHPEEVRIILNQDPTTKGISRNVVATIEGTECPEETVVFCGHYDSVEFSDGAWDNATGSVTVMEMMHYFKENKPRRTLKFVWCGSEEIGLLGSWNYCEMHKDELDKVILNINFDMVGVWMGTMGIFGSAHKSLIDRALFMGKVEGFKLNSHMGLMSSDSTSFALHGVPAISFGSMGPRGGAEIHSRRDTISNVDKDYLYRSIDFISRYSAEIINAKLNVVPRELPKEAKDQEAFMRSRLGL